MRVCALDLGVTTGWCMGTRTGWESGTVSFPLFRGESPGMRYYRFRRWLEDNTGDVDLYVYEQTVAGPGAIAREIAANFAGRVQETAARRDAQHAAVYPATLKKWLTGSGKAGKPAMLAAVLARWGHADTDHQADAIACFHYAWAVLLPAGPERPRPLVASPRARP